MRAKFAYEIPAKCQPDDKTNNSHQAGEDFLLGYQKKIMKN